MKPTCLAIFLIAVVSAEDFYYTANGDELLCGNCMDYEACDATNGKCTNGCATGWTTVDTSADCQDPSCEDVKCGGNAGVCVSHNQCACLKNYAQAEDGGCYSMRTDGLKGAFLAMLILICAISFCGGVQQYFEKKRIAGGKTIQD